MHQIEKEAKEYQRRELGLKALACGIPDYMVEGITLYVVDHIASGDFLMHLFCNDFMGAVGRADSTNINLLKNYAIFMYNEMPSQSHGSPEKVKKWLEQKQQE